MSGWSDQLPPAIGHDSWGIGDPSASAQTEFGHAGTAYTGDATNLDGGFGQNDARSGALVASGGGGGACRNCGQDGHFARDCPEPRKFGGECFNCGEEGHSKADCDKPRKIKGGPCHTCGVDGHLASECPDRVCNNCKQPGHEAYDCQNPMKLTMDHVEDKSEEEAWAMLKSASDIRDIGDFKEAVLVLSKACPDYTYAQLERQFRKRGYNVYVIAMEKDHGDTWTNVNLQGETGKKYAVSYFTTNKPHRPSLASKWPGSAEENLSRLADAGTPMDRGISKCRNCDEIGHASINCPQEKREPVQIPLECHICGEIGHRVRDCKQERKASGGRTCKICEQEGHIAKECPNREPKACRNCGAEDHVRKDCPTLEKPTCRKCGSEDHLARDCMEPPKVNCFYCTEDGHMSKDCPKRDDPSFKPPKRDWSTFTCPICKEKGHGRARCPQNKEPDPATKDGGGFSAGGGWGQPTDTTSSAPAGWESSPVGQTAGGW